MAREQSMGERIVRKQMEKDGLLPPEPRTTGFVNAGDYAGPYSLLPREPAALTQLAIDYCDQMIFGSWNVPSEHNQVIPVVFQPLQRERHQPENLAHVYQYHAKAVQQVHGYPVFMACGVLTLHEWPVFVEMINAIIQAKRAGEAAAAQIAAQWGRRD